MYGWDILTWSTIFVDDSKVTLQDGMSKYAFHLDAETDVCSQLSNNLAWIDIVPWQPYAFIQLHSDM